MAGLWSRLSTGGTTFNFYGRKKIGFGVSLAALLITLGSLFTQGLNLGIDFKGGVAFEVPVSATMSTDKAEEVLKAQDINLVSAKLQTLSSDTESRVRIQLGELEDEKVTQVQNALAAQAKIKVADVSVSKVSSTWGRSITVKALQALLTFFVVVSLYIWWQFKEAGMAFAAIMAVVHDVGVSVGVYSVLQLEVTPATVVAFLTILGFSLYDTIVVFDKVKDNAQRFSGSKVSYGDIVNVSMNQVLMRSLNTSIAALLPVLSLLILGSGVFGAIALREFALALVVGLATGAYSSIYIATPLLAVVKERSLQYKPLRGQLATGSDMAHLMKVGAPVSRRASSKQAVQSDSPAAPPVVDTILSHPPRPRKKSRR